MISLKITPPVMFYNSMFQTRNSKSNYLKQFYALISTDLNCFSREKLVEINCILKAVAAMLSKPFIPTAVSKKIIVAAVF